MNQPQQHSRLVGWTRSAWGRPYHAVIRTASGEEKLACGGARRIWWSSPTCYVAQDETFCERIGCDGHAAAHRNKKLGLLCACNAVRVPYYGEDGQPEHGTKLVDGVLHGYDDCSREGDR